MAEQSSHLPDLLSTALKTLAHSFLLAAIAGALLSGPASHAAQSPAAADPLVREGTTVKVSDHVYVIPDASTPGVPNVGIIVGSRATLVIDTGLGPKNGETILREVRKVSRNRKLYLVTTHFHPEHLLGAGAFPPETVVIMARTQQQDVEEFGAQTRQTFRERSAAMAGLLRNAEFPSVDISFDQSLDMDLGAVTLQIFWAGPTHTRGDTAIFVDEDKVLFSGDVAMKDAFPAFASPYASVGRWLSSLRRMKELNPALVVPSHGSMGEASIIDRYSDYLTAVQSGVNALKAQGRSVDEASELLTKQLSAQFPTLESQARIAGAVQSAYRD
ncbi:MAG: MBL fold metallo-hydrolase [Steroidobacteraceae bacterium]